jgi:NAD(P)-dependent dehydrogenase (short-subunit alcohol dehydrogenase family)
VFDKQQIEEAVAQTTAKLGKPSILVNNAQGGHMGGGVPLADTTDEMLDESFRGGPLATLRAMRACFPTMRETGGTIVNFASSTGVMGDPGFTAYGVSKEAIRALTKHAAREWGEFGITVNVICPAAMTENLRATAAEKPRWIEAVRRQIPLGRLGDPLDDIAPTVVSLASDLHYLTGATIMLDGGRCILR